jgi:transcriptional regulator with GAF, ATPase, and Fis domain
VGEIPLELQSKFLRVLQEKQYERVGEDRTRTVDVRIIAATNRNLKKEVESGHFRQDLFYRLNVFPIEVAPLRSHPEDIPLLAAYFLEQAAQRLKVPPTRLTKAHVLQLQSYDWPGNVRELQNSIERALIVAQSQGLSFDIPVSGSVPDQVTHGILTDDDFRRRERANVLAALNKARWKIHGPGGAAEILGLKPTTLISRIAKLDLKKTEPGVL